MFKYTFILVLFYVASICKAEIQWSWMMHSPWKLSDERDIKNEYGKFLDTEVSDVYVTTGQIIAFLERQLKTVNNRPDRLKAAATLFTILKHDTPEDMATILNLLQRCYGEEGQKLFEEALEMYHAYEKENSQNNEKKEYAKGSQEDVFDTIITEFTNI